MNLNLYYER